jgi:membrane-associated protease RseP (regulator of RpoE activity)
MIYVQGAIGLLLLVVVLTAASYWGARAAASALAVPDFRWFGVRPAAAPWWKRFCVRAASTLSAVLVAVATSFVVLLVYGTTELTTIVKVLPGPAQRAGMLDDDKILSIDGTPVNTSEDVRAAVARGPDEKRVEVQRGSERLVLPVTRSDGRIAVQFVERRLPIGIPTALATALRNTLSVTDATLKAMAPSAKVEVTGPVGIVRETGKQTDAAGSFLTLMGVLAA